MEDKLTGHEEFKFLLSKEQQEDEYKRLLNSLDEDIVKNQANQILNYAYNESEGNIPVYSLYTNCSMVIKESFDEEDINKGMSKDEIKKKEDVNSAFKKSLDNSGYCIISPKDYQNRIEHLEAGKDESFIMAPVLAKGHVFSIAIYKKDVNNYEFVVINKGSRTFDLGAGKKRHHAFESYIIPKENIEKLIPLLDVGTHVATKKTSEIYDMLQENALDKKYEELTDIDARGQRVGNCYYKEVEEGLKYVYFRVYSRYDKLKFRSEYNKDLKTPKLPGGTQKFHIKLLSNIIKHTNNPKVKEFVEDLIDTYDKNKNFRNRMREKSDMTQEEKEGIFVEVFGSKDTNLKDEASLKECLKKVDERTLQENLDFFVDVLKNGDVQIPMVLESAKKTSVDFIYASKEYIKAANNDNDMKFLKEYFPNVAHKIQKTMDYEKYREVMDQKIINVKDIEKLKDLDIGYYNKATVYSTLASYKKEQEDLYGALELYEKSLQLVRNKAPLRKEHVETKIGEINKEIRKEKGKNQV